MLWILGFKELVWDPQEDVFYFFNSRRWYRWYNWLNVCVSHSLISWKLNPNVIWGDVRQGLWEVMRSWGWSPHDHISVLRRRDTREPLSVHLFLSVLWGHSDKLAVYKPGRRPLPVTWHLGLGLPSLQNWEGINFRCLSHPVYGVCYGSQSRLIQIPRLIICYLP